MTRFVDIILVVLMGLVLVPVMLGVALAILFLEGRPVLFVSERMKTPTQPFGLIKFRTMSHVSVDAGVSGGDKADRVTQLGAFLRKTRMDELPQLWNILRGDIGYVGPRPPLRRYVDHFPTLYKEVLRVRPGVTGLATLMFHKTEEAMLATCQTPEDTEAIYEAYCIPVKAELDIFYADHQTPSLDVRIMIATVWRKLPPVPKRVREVIPPKISGVQK